MFVSRRIMESALRKRYPYAPLSVCLRRYKLLGTCVAVSMHGRENQRGLDKKWVAVATSIIRLHGSEEKKRRDAMIYAVELMCC